MKKTVIHKVIKFFTHHQKFSKKKLGHMPTYQSYGDIFRNMSRKTLIKVGIFFVSFGVLIFYSKYIFQFASAMTSSFSHTAVSVISKNFGTGMKQDQYGNVNILLIGVGGEEHAGGYLADTIIAVSFNVRNNSVSMVSIPRDLYVYKKGEYHNKINAIFALGYTNSQGNFKIAAKGLQDKVGEILNMDIPYYAIMDFKGFESMVDSLGGVFIDVPYTIQDSHYPGPNNTYKTFRIDAGPQMLDGATALKYARSRKTTSDFSRSARQQMIIKAIIHQAMSTKNFTSISRIKELYNQYTKMIVTNITLKEMLGMLQYTNNIPDIFSFNLTYECEETRPNSIQAGCLLIPGVREEFNGMAVLLPKGANGYHPSFYDYIHFFAYMVMKNPEYLSEHATINIYNAIDIHYARKYNAMYRNGLATKLGGMLRRYGFTIGDTDNAQQTLDLTTAVVHGDISHYTNTIKMLKLYLDVPSIETQQEFLGSGNILSGNIASGSQSTIDLYLGKDFIDRFGKSKFKMYKK